MGSRSVASMQWRGAPSPNRRLFRTINGCSLGHRLHSRCLDAALHNSHDTATTFCYGSTAAICRLRNGRSRACDVRAMAHGPVWPRCSATYGPSPMPEATFEATHRALRLDRLGCCSASGGSVAARWRVCQRQGRPTPPRIIGLAAPRPCAVTSPKILKITETPRSPSTQWGVRDRLRRGLRTPPVRVTSDC
jgi:hypothetical protein